MITIRKSHERGHFNWGWLNTYHTFSFSDYFDRRWVNFRSLRVINEDWIAPAQGFGTHPHRDMEIITYIISGALEHRDSMGNGAVLKPSDIQRMSAGTGITHSEFNGSKTEACHLLQIWLFPENVGIEPSYEDHAIPREEKIGRLRPIASPDRREGSAVIHQDAVVYASVLPEGAAITHAVGAGRAVWLQLISGTIDVNGTSLEAGDGAGLEEVEIVEIKAGQEAEFLLFDLK